MNFDRAFSRLEHSGNGFEQGTLSGSVEAENSEPFALFNGERNIPERPELRKHKLVGNELYKIFL